MIVKAICPLIPAFVYLEKDKEIVKYFVYIDSLAQEVHFPENYSEEVREAILFYIRSTTKPYNIPTIPSVKEEMEKNI